MYKLGITGGIGSGKSTASNFLKESGATVFNADQEAKKHLKNHSVLQRKLITFSLGESFFLCIFFWDK